MTLRGSYVALCNQNHELELHPKHWPNEGEKSINATFVVDVYFSIQKLA